MSRLSWLFSVLLSVSLVDAARAVDNPVAGLKLVVVDTTASNGKSKMVLVAKDAAIAKGSGTDAVEISGWMEVAHTEGNGSYDLPQGAGWVANTSKVATYVHKDAPFQGSVKKAIVKPGSVLKIVAKSLGDDNPLEISVPPPDGSVYATATILNDGDETRLCMRFTECEHKVLAGGTGYKLTCDSGVGDPSCLAAMPPPTTTITSVVTNGPASAMLTFGADNPATFYCAMDGAGFQPCSSPGLYTGLSAGTPHTFEVYGVNILSRVGTPASRNWYSPPPALPPPFSLYELEHTLTLDTISLVAPTPHPVYPAPQLTSRIAYVEPGASVTLDLAGSFSYTNLGSPYCPGCLTSFYVGITGHDIAPSGSTCLGNGTAGPVAVNVSNHVFTAPSTPGVYFLNTSAYWEYFCAANYSTLDSDFGPNTIAVLVVEP
jgi:hypothetical protein